MPLEFRRISISGKLIAIIILVLVVLAVGIFSWYYYQKHYGWAIYTNQKFGYSFKYPRGWTLDTQNANIDYSKGIGGWVTLSNHENGPAQLSAGNPPSDLIVIKFNVYKVATSATMGQITRGEALSLLQQKTSFLINNTFIAGIAGKEFIYNEPDAQNNLVTVKTVAKHDTDMFVLTCNYIRQDLTKENKYKLPDAAASAYNGVLASFKLK